MTLVSLMFAALLLVCCLSTVVYSAVDDDDFTGFPERPKTFRSPEELKEYLRTLNDYFAIAGRPRSMTLTLLDNMHYYIVYIVI